MFLVLQVHKACIEQYLQYFSRHFQHSNFIKKFQVFVHTLFLRYRFYRQDLASYFFACFAKKLPKSIKCQLCLSTLELFKFRAQEDPWFSACTFLLSPVVLRSDRQLMTNPRVILDSQAHLPLLKKKKYFPYTPLSYETLFTCKKETIEAIN